MTTTTKITEVNVTDREHPDEPATEPGPCVGAPELCGAAAGQPCEPGRPSPGRGRVLARGWLAGWSAS